MAQQDPVLTAKLNLETGRVAWRELERHFARGVLRVVHPQLDLVAVSAALSQDDSATVQSWIDNQQLHEASMDDAARWHDSQTEFWAIVVAPWVLVQAVND